MRSVQGYRPFMRWKGSVVDSVVGVFLTQSASDSSSSSAFMYLAAKYPNQITTGDHTEHAIDWNAVRTAQHSDISNAIEERGMKNKIAQRIQVSKSTNMYVCVCVEREGGCSFQNQ
ncbi:putative DNA glycosylase [Helianthus annuus]|nr:putative DNA glycosylase [Helianthus annuus]